MEKTILRILICCLLVAHLMATDRCMGQEPESSDDAADARYELLVEHAKTNMQLAEVELQYALEEHRKSPGVIPKLTIERLRSNLAVAKEQYTETTLASIGGPERVRLRHAEEKVRLAKLALQKGQQMKKSGGINQLELRRLELKHDLAKLNVALINHPEKFVTLLYHLEAKLNHLGEEILALDQRITNLEPLR